MRVSKLKAARDPSLKNAIWQRIVALSMPFLKLRRPPPAAAASGAVVDLNVNRPPADHRADPSDLLDLATDETLSAEARIDAHHQHEIETVQHIFDRAFRRRRIERRAGRFPACADQLQRAVEMLAGFRMNGDDVGGAFAKASIWGRPARSSDGRPSPF
jgi:hypothetical protein